MRHTLFLGLVLISPIYGADSASRSLEHSSTATVIPVLQQATFSQDVEAARLPSDHEHHRRRHSRFKIKMAAVTTVTTALIGAGLTLGIRYIKCQD